MSRVITFARSHKVATALLVAIFVLPKIGTPHIWAGVSAAIGATAQLLIRRRTASGVAQRRLEQIRTAAFVSAVLLILW